MTIQQFFESLAPAIDLEYRIELIEMREEIYMSMLEGSVSENSSVFAYVENGKLTDFYYDKAVMDNMRAYNSKTYELYVEDIDKCVEFKASEFVWWLFKYTAGLPTLEEMRKFLGITRKEAAAFLLIPSRSYENWEYGKTTPPIYVERYIFDSFIEKIRHICNLDILQLNRIGIDASEATQWRNRVEVLYQSDITKIETRDERIYNDDWDNDLNQAYARELEGNLDDSY